MRINYGILMAGALALATACGAGQRNTLPVGHYSEAWVEGVHKNNKGEIYAIGCVDYNQEIPLNFLHLTADTVAGSHLMVAQNESRVSRETNRSSRNGSQEFTSRTSTSASGNIGGTRNTGYTIRDGEICSRIERFKF